MYQATWYKFQEKLLNYIVTYEAFINPTSHSD